MIAAAFLRAIISSAVASPHDGTKSGIDTGRSPLDSLLHDSTMRLVGCIDHAHQHRFECTPGQAREPGTRNGELGVSPVKTARRSDLAPLNGLWTQAQYLRMTQHARLLLEFTDGCIEVLSMPTDGTRRSPGFFSWRCCRSSATSAARCAMRRCACAFATASFGNPTCCWFAMRTTAAAERISGVAPTLVMEVVSPDDPDRDLRIKPLDYAEAGIPEYWIVNPMDETVTVLVLRAGAYAEHGRFCRGQRADSVLPERLFRGCGRSLRRRLTS